MQCHSLCTAWGVSIDLILNFTESINSLGVTEWEEWPKNTDKLLQTNHDTNYWWCTHCDKQRVITPFSTYHKAHKENIIVYEIVCYSVDITPKISTPYGFHSNHPNMKDTNILLKRRSLMEFTQRTKVCHQCERRIRCVYNMVPKHDCMIMSTHPACVSSVLGPPSLYSKKN